MSWQSLLIGRRKISGIPFFFFFFFYPLVLFFSFGGNQVCVYLVCIPWKCIRSFYGREDEEVKEERRKKMVLVLDLDLRVPPVLPPKKTFCE